MSMLSCFHRGEEVRCPLPTRSISISISIPISDPSLASRRRHHLPASPSTPFGSIDEVLAPDSRMIMAALQLGLVAACVVLLVPMGMAGWHLSRNKMLFFSGALFITLAVGVHLTPYLHLLALLPSSSSSSSSSSTTIQPLPSSTSCLSSLHHLLWSTQSSSISWSFPPSSSSAAACSTFQYQRLSASDTSDLLNGSWVVVAGDSQARLFTLSLLRLLLPPISMQPVEVDLFKRHSDYHLLIPERSITVDFFWAPFVSNVSHLLLYNLSSFLTARFPDVLITGAGLWDMLHFTDASAYADSLLAVSRAAATLLDPIGVQSTTHMFWLGMPTLVNSMLNTEEKRLKMNQTTWEAYEREVLDGRLLRGSGGPFLLLDIGLLSGDCGPKCTADGMHYGGVVYEAALHIMLNALLIESQQRI